MLCILCRKMNNSLYKHLLLFSSTKNVSLQKKTQMACHVAWMTWHSLVSKFETWNSAPCLSLIIEQPHGMVIVSFMKCKFMKHIFSCCQTYTGEVQELLSHTRMQTWKNTPMRTSCSSTGEQAVSFTRGTLQISAQPNSFVHIAWLWCSVSSV